MYFVTISLVVMSICYGIQLVGGSFEYTPQNKIFKIQNLQDDKFYMGISAGLPECTIQGYLDTVMTELKPELHVSFLQLTPQVAQVAEDDQTESTIYLRYTKYKSDDNEFKQKMKTLGDLDHAISVDIIRLSQTHPLTKDMELKRTRIRDLINQARNSLLCYRSMNMKTIKTAIGSLLIPHKNTFMMDMLGAFVDYKYKVFGSGLIDESIRNQCFDTNITEMIKECAGHINSNTRDYIMMGSSFGFQQSACVYEMIKIHDGFSITDREKSYISFAIKSKIAELLTTLDAVTKPMSKDKEKQTDSEILSKKVVRWDKIAEISTKAQIYLTYMKSLPEEDYKKEMETLTNIQKKITKLITPDQSINV